MLRAWCSGGRYGCRALVPSRRGSHAVHAEEGREKGTRRVQRGDHQRYVELDAGVRRGNEVKLTLPANERAAPRGIYMLWLITNTGTPSEAKWVVLR